MSTDVNVLSRLGEPGQVAEAAVTAYRQRSFIGRHPAAALLVFGISPLASLIVLIGLLAAGMWGIDEACTALGVDTANVLRDMTRFESATSVVPYVLSLLTVVLPCILVCIFYGKLAKRLGTSRKWVLLSCAVLAMVAVTVDWQLRLVRRRISPSGEDFQTVLPGDVSRNPG